jgi:hypothetical protein
MSDEASGPSSSEGGEELESEDARAIAALVKRSLASEAAPRQADSVLVGVQRKIRQRSRGKFYGDGWSTTNARMSYVLVAICMLVVVAVAYFALGPVGIVAR